ncbi:MAG: hypothetical protein GF355_16075 [Candidatus Eisenbacteria bacterium]|nr:hypothetical protein [Candidatus Eisenbacteria bacterium]
MLPSRSILKVCAALALALLVPLSGAVPQDTQVSRVVLKDGRALAGVLRLLEPSLYLLDSEDGIYEISGSEIQAVDGVPGPPDLEPPGERILRYATFEVVSPEGHIDIWSRMEVPNESHAAWTYTQWGVKPRELERYQTMELRDSFGNLLPLELEPRPNSDLYTARAQLVVPVAPGEDLVLLRKFRGADAVHRDDNRLTVTFMGDFPEHRIYHRKLQLPHGARIVEISPQPAVQFTYRQRPVIVWRRFYPRGERFPLQVTYELPQASQPQ